MFPIFGRFFRFFRSSSTLYAVHLADFFHARYKCTKDHTRLKNFSIRFRTGVMAEKSLEKNAKKKQFVIIPT